MGILDAPSLTKRSYYDQRPSGNIGQRIFGGRMGTYNNTTATTFQITCELQQHFDAIQVIFANSNPGYSDNAVQVKASVLSSAADLNGSGGTWTTVTKSGLLRIAMPIAPATNRLSYILSDVIPLASLPRSDGGTKPLVVVRAYMGTSATLPVLGNGTSDVYTNWASRSDGHLWAMRLQTGDAVTDPTLFTSTTNVSQSPIVGIRYFARGRVINVMGVGDSITEGRGTYVNEGFGIKIADRLSTDGTTIEYSNCGWSGQNTVTFGERALDILGSPIKPDILLFPSCSPNNEASLTDAGFIASAAMRERVLSQCAQAGVVPVLWTMLPTNPSIHDWGADDAKRIADNAKVLAMRERGYLVGDTSTALSGTTDADGQVSFDPTYTTDGIHPNDAGSLKMADVLTPLVQRAGGLL